MKGVKSPASCADCKRKLFPGEIVSVDDAGLVRCLSCRLLLWDKEDAAAEDQHVDAALERHLEERHGSAS